MCEIRFINIKDPPGKGRVVRMKTARRDVTPVRISYTCFCGKFGEINRLLYIGSLDFEGISRYVESIYLKPYCGCFMAYKINVEAR